MLPPSSGSETEGETGAAPAVLAAATLEASPADTATLIDTLKALELSRLGRLRELSHIAAPEPLPDLGSEDVTAWCASTLERGDRIAGLARVIGFVGETYRHRGWAVLAAGIGAGERVTDLPPFDELVPAVSQWFDARAADAAVAALDGAPDLAALAAAGVPPPGHALVATLGTLAEAIAAEPGGLAIAAALAEQVTEPWTWERVLAWSVDDPTAWAKAAVRAVDRRSALLLDDDAPPGDPRHAAIARTGGARTFDTGAWVRAIDDVRISIASELEALLDVQWTAALADARAAVAPLATDPLLAAIAAFGDRAHAEAARRLARAARDDIASVGSLCARLVGDPREVDTWAAAVPALLAALPVNPGT